MSVQSGKGKKKRNHKVSAGKNSGGGKVRLTALEKALMTPYLDQAAARMRRRTEKIA